MGFPESLWLKCFKHLYRNGQDILPTHGEKVRKTVICMDLKITTQPALIGIKTTPARLSIQQRKADVEMNTEHPKVEIRTEPIRVQIDQYECFAEAGLKNLFDLTLENAGYSYRQAMAGIERIARQGNEMADIHLNTNPIADQAEENAYELYVHEVNFDMIPKSRPKIDFVGGDLDIRVKEGGPNIKVQINKPIIRYHPGKVEIYLRQKHSVHIEYVGKKLDVFV